MSSPAPFTQKNYYPGKSFSSVIHHYEWFEVGKIPEILVHPNFATGFIFFFFRKKPLKIQIEEGHTFETTVNPLIPSLPKAVKNIQIDSLNVFRVIFQPGILSQIFGISMGYFRCYMVDAQHLDREIKYVHEQMHEEIHPMHCIRVFETFLLRKLSLSQRPQLFPAAQQVIQREGFNISVNTFARELGMSTRQLNRKLTEQIGYSPKEFLKVHRICSVLQFLRTQPTINFCETAYHFGYFDQAHFNHEFTQMIGQSPSQFLAQIGKEETEELTRITHSGIFFGK